MLAEMPKAVGTKLNGKNIGGHIVVPPINDAKTLSDIGITKNESSRWQKLANVSEDVRVRRLPSCQRTGLGEGSNLFGLSLLFYRPDKQRHIFIKMPHDQGLNYFPDGCPALCCGNL